jgi:hypothetical protein
MKGGKKMLDSIWQLLANYGLDTGEIADGISSLFTVTETTDAEGNVVTEYGGSLAALADFPIIGMVLQAFASFTPSVEETIA